MSVGRASDLSKQPAHQPYNHHDWNSKNRSKNSSHTQEKYVILPRMAVWLPQMAYHERVVAAVRFPGNVESVAYKRDSPDQHIDGKVHHHTDKRDIRNTAKPRRDNDDARCKSGKDIAQPGDQPYDSVETEAYRCPGHPKPVVEKVRKQIKIFIGKPGSRDPGPGMK